jgi:diguanylate cyclase (GGDEF)-like protein
LDNPRLPRNVREWLEVIHPDDREAFRDVAIEAARDGECREFDYRVRQHDAWIDVHHVMVPLADETGAGEHGRRWFNTVQDITGQKQAEARIRRLNRVYAVLSGINTLIVRTSDREELFREACRIAVHDGQFAKAWIGVFDDGQSVVRIVAWHGAGDALYNNLQARLRAEAARGEGLVALASRGIEPVLANDIEHDERIAGRDILASTGSRSVAIFPLVIDGKSVGLFSLHATTPGFFDSQEMKLLGELAGDIGFALDHLSKTERILYLAEHDALTGLPNRRRFTERLSQRLKVADPGNRMLAVALFDLERFRRVNETMGRTGGDELLKLVANRLKLGNPTTAHLAENLFAMEIAGHYSAADIARAVEEIVSRCFGEPFALSGHELRIGCRGGIAVFPYDGVDAETLLRNAEAALHRAKTTTEHRVFYAPDMNAQAAESLALESRLRRAIERQEFVLHYQPKVNLDDGRICGVEALIRWQDPEQVRGVVPQGWPQRRRSADPLAGSRAGAGAAGRVHLLAGGIRPDRRSRALGTWLGLGRSSPLARCRTRFAVRCGQRVPHPVAPAGFCRAHRGHHHRRRRLGAGAGNHRKPADGQRGPQCRHPEGNPRPRCEDFHRRLRHWLQLALLYRAVADHGAEDRS